MSNSPRLRAPIKAVLGAALAAANTSNELGKVAKRLVKKKEVRDVA